MPCLSWGISATHCRLGAILGQKEGNVCHEDICYAKQRNYLRQNVQDKLEERYEGLFNIAWTPALASLIHRKAEKYFRLFDSGDLQSESMLRNIIRIAQVVRDVLIWMPSREVKIIGNVRLEIAKLGIDWPSNLIPRISATRVDGKPPKGFEYTSTVVSDPEQATCIAQRQHNKCDGPVGSCRACWHEKNVDYPLH